MPLLVKWQGHIIKIKAEISAFFVPALDIVRGNRKVQAEIVLIIMAYNVNKLHHKICDNRTGRQLHGKLSV